jgi:alkanesulfonate monooxygenase SsuD/methylene tetrahydromethanopterin reductase-like flavin-dependent oxidoreductase (luciferase family)
MQGRMRFGFVLPGGDARTAADLAEVLEAAGWDGLFVWEPVWGVDAWVSLTAAAMRTERLRLGTMLSPLSRMRPWDVAGKAATLDNLSGGRVTLSVGLGAVDTGFAEFGEATEIRVRAALLDESLDIIQGLWAGQPFRYDGAHYHVRPTQFALPPPPVQRPRIPIWAVGVWPRPKSMRRVAVLDGWIPQLRDPADAPVLAEGRAWLAARRPAAAPPIDVIVEGTSPGDDPAAAAEALRPWVEAGATWWIEAMWTAGDGQEGREAIFQRARQGPPPLSSPAIPR